MTQYQLLFGKYKGKLLSEIPDNYLLWLAKPKYSGKFYESIHSTELNWRVPFFVKLLARAEAEKRGFVLKGETWDKDE
jgi:hypothetical protein